MKKYNPLKMWGSWIGLGLGILLSYLSIKNFWYDLIDTNISFNCGMFQIGSEGFNQCAKIWINMPMLINVQYVIYAVMGFLIGWGIHSLIRRYWK